MYQWLFFLSGHSFLFFLRITIRSVRTIIPTAWLIIVLTSVEVATPNWVFATTIREMTAPVMNDSK